MEALVTAPRSVIIFSLIISFLLGAALGSSIVILLELRRFRNLLKGGEK